jgi:hypothetical protein
MARLGMGQAFHAIPAYPGTSDTSWRSRPVDDGGRPLSHVLYLVVSGAPAPEGVPGLVTACQAAGWRVVVFSTPAGTRFVDAVELERMTGEPVRSGYRMPGTGASVPPADAVLACPLTFNSVRCSTSSTTCSERIPAARSRAVNHCSIRLRLP